MVKKIFVHACMLNHLSHVQLSVIPCIVAHQAPLSMGILQIRIWSGLPLPPPGDLPDPRIEPVSPALQADSLPLEPSEKPHVKWCVTVIFKLLFPNDE